MHNLALHHANPNVSSFPELWSASVVNKTCDFFSKESNFTIGNLIKVGEEASCLCNANQSDFCARLRQAPSVWKKCNCLLAISNCLITSHSQFSQNTRSREANVNACVGISLSAASKVTTALLGVTLSPLGQMRWGWEDCLAHVSQKDMGKQ